jgi:hypothetical protein
MDVWGDTVKAPDRGRADHLAVVELALTRRPSHQHENEQLGMVIPGG